MSYAEAVEVGTTVRQTGESREYYFSKGNSDNVRQLVQALEQSQEVDYIDEVEVIVEARMGIR